MHGLVIRTCLVALQREEKQRSEACGILLHVSIANVSRPVDL